MVPGSPRCASENHQVRAVDVRKGGQRGGGAAGRHTVFVCYVLAMLLAFLLPLPESPVAEANQVDKLVHFGIFLGLTLLFYRDRHPRPVWAFLVASAFAGAIELVQWGVGYRDGDWLDFAAGAAGAGVAVLWLLLRARRATGAR